MPVTIGPFTNVPAPNDPIRSPWAQQITTYAVDLAKRAQPVQGAGLAPVTLAAGAAPVTAQAAVPAGVVGGAAWLLAFLEVSVQVVTGPCNYAIDIRDQSGNVVGAGYGNTPSGPQVLDTAACFAMVRQGTISYLYGAARISSGSGVTSIQAGCKLIMLQLRDIAVTP